VSLVEQKLLTLPEHLSSHPVLGGIHLVHIVQLHVFTFLIQFCGVRYDFVQERHSVHLSSYLFCMEFMFYFRYLYFLTGVHHDFYITWCSEMRRVSIVEQELLTLPEHQSSPPVFCGVLVARSFVFCLVLYREVFGLLSFFGHCIVCPTICGFWDS
jgi:hypothetical protein